MPRLVDHAARRGAFEDAACAEIARVGIDGVRLRDIAARIGLTTGSLVHYYPDKRALLRSALIYVAARMEGRMRAHLKRDPLDAVAFFREALPLAEEARIDCAVWFQFCAVALHDPLVRRRQKALHRRWLAAIAIGLPDGAPEQVERLAATINGLVMRVLLEPEDWPPERQIMHLDLALRDAGVSRAPEDPT